MKKSDIINKLHSSIILYFLTAWIFESQRQTLILLLPSIQFQFLINNNQCVLTQIEKKLLIQEQIQEKNLEKNQSIIYDSFVEKKCKEYNIHLQPKIREYIIHSAVYCSFLISYFMI